MKAIHNNVIVSLQKKFYEEIKFPSGVTVHFDPSWHPEEYARLEATVISVPHCITERADYKGLSVDIEPGDKILMRYDVVFAYRDQPDRDTPIYKNLAVRLEDGLKEYWFCDIQKVFAVFRGEEIIMQNGYVMVDMLDAEVPPSSLIIPTYLQKQPSRNRAAILNIGKPLSHRPELGLQKGDEILFIPGVAQPYQIGINKFWIIKQSHILAKLV